MKMEEIKTMISWLEKELAMMELDAACPVIARGTPGGYGPRTICHVANERRFQCKVARNLKHPDPMRHDEAQALEMKDCNDCNFPGYRSWLRQQ
ncbi:hypothetical protein [Microbispora rosea]|uniref:hypothetical protein n=1 Tax=Microbispora rosea TaxID=58117 RepID=UPI003D9160F3